MKIVTCDYEFPTLNAENKAFSCVPNLEFIPTRGKKSEAELIELTKDADGVLNQYNFLTANVINNMEKCKVIATYGIGVDKIDINAASKKGIYVCNVPAYGVNEVADHAFAMILALSRQLFTYDKMVRNGVYGSTRIGRKLHRLEGQTVGLIGYGKIPRNLGKKLINSFDMRILIFDPFITDEFAKEDGVIKVDLETLMKESDFVSVHAPLTNETKYMINEEMLRLMKSSAYIVNCARGAVVKEEDLVKVLKDNAIAGAATDVFEIEPVTTDNPLLHLDNVIVTPHAAYYTEEAVYALQYGAAEAVARVLNGEEPIAAVNRNAVDELLKK